MQISETQGIARKANEADRWYKMANIGGAVLKLLWVVHVDVARGKYVSVK